MFTGSVLSTASGVVFALLLVFGALSDIRARRIPNLLAGTLAILGVVYAFVASREPSRVAWAFAGIGTGLAVWVPFYLLGMLGAGDVKFFAGASAWLGPKVALSAAALAAVSGGVLALTWVLWSVIASRLARTAAVTAGAPLQEVTQNTPAPRSLPYGVAMAVGIGLALWFAQLAHVGR